MSEAQRWWVADPALVKEIEDALTGPYATLTLKVSAHAVTVRGTFPVVDGGEVLDRYQIAMSFPYSYPDDPPSVSETDGRIPRTAARHNSSGEACLFVPMEWKLRRPDSKFATFLGGPVRSYFLSQSLVELGQPWPFQERSHGMEGILEAIVDVLGLQNVKQAAAFALLLAKPTIKGHWECPCGSGVRLRSCHGAQVRKLITDENQRFVRAQIKSYVEAHQRASGGSA